MDIRERCFPLRVLGTAQAPQGMGTARGCQSSRDTQGGIVGVSVQGQELDWMVLVGLFPPRLCLMLWMPLQTQVSLA